MIKSKKYYADRVVLALQDSFPDIDWRIDQREIFVAVDDVVNAMAKDNYFENWKLYGPTVDESFITTWDGDNAIDVVDPDNQPSYMVLPSEFAALPMNNGIQEVWPLNYEFGAVRLRLHQDIRRTRNLMSGNMQQELGGYARGNLFVFDQVEVRKNFSEKFGLRMVIKDSTALSETAPYPIPGNIAEEVIRRVVMFFTGKRFQPADTVRDKNDSINRN